MTGAQQERDGDGAWERLRRRKVVQWGLAYGLSNGAIGVDLGFTDDLETEVESHAKNENVE